MAVVMATQTGSRCFLNCTFQELPRRGYNRRIILAMLLVGVLFFNMDRTIHRGKTGGNTHTFFRPKELKDDIMLDSSAQKQTLDVRTVPPRERNVSTVPLEAMEWQRHCHSPRCCRDNRCPRGTIRYLHCFRSYNNIQIDIFRHFLIFIYFGFV